MATATLATGKRRQMTIAEKAKLLRVVDIHEDGVLAVVSNTNPNNAYVVSHDGTHAHRCPCEARVKCSHMYAVERRLHQIYRETFPGDFN